jgi:ABC-2 type transport system permease protein
VTTVALVATREFTERLRSRAFLISNAAILGLLLIAGLLPVFLGDEEPSRVGVVGGQAQQVADVAQAQQATFGIEVVAVPLADRRAAEAALRADDVDVALVDGGTALTTTGIGRQLEALLTSAQNAVAVDAALAGAGLDLGGRAALLELEPLQVEQLERTGGLDVFDPAIGVIFLAVFLLYGLLAIYGQWVAQGIVEEKQSRVVEVLLVTVRPSQLLAGKILGLGALGLAQVLLMGAAGVATLLVTDLVDVPAAAWRGLALVLPWYVLGFLMYATLFAVAGALVSRVEDVQSTTMPVILVLVLALFGAQVALSDPSGGLATFAGLFPLTAPIVLPVLVAVGAATWLEVVLAIVAAGGAIAVMLPFAARVYSGGLLRNRGRVSLREAWTTGR